MVSKSNENNNNSQAKNNEQSNTSNKGFASMPKEKVKEIAAKGGRHSHDNTNSKKDNK